MISVLAQNQEPALAGAVPRDRFRAAADAAIQALVRRASTTGDSIGDGHPHFADPATGAWTTTADGDWTGGFWAGWCWLASSVSPQAHHVAWATRTLGKLKPRLRSDSMARGFLFLYGAAPGWQLRRDPDASALALAAAGELARTFNPSAGVFGLGDEVEEAERVGQCETAIDSVASLALLGWAARRAGRQDWLDMLTSHARRHVGYCLRPDGSISQSATFDRATGDVVERYTHKGLSPDSTWARGHAWGMLGFTDAFRYTGQQDLLAAAQKTCDWWILHAPTDRAVLWDFAAPVAPETPHDSSASAIACAALLRLAACCPDPQRAGAYRRAAISTLDGLLATSLDDRGVFTDGCFDARRGLATRNELVWGSYFLLEALLVATGRLAVAAPGAAMTPAGPVPSI